MNSREMAAPHHDKLGLHESGSHSVTLSHVIPVGNLWCILWYMESESVVLFREISGFQFDNF